MILLRATFLLLLLSALLSAAPSPLPRPKKQETGGWSQPVDGLRVRLLAPRTRYRVGDAVRLALELQNVSGSPLVIEEPELWPAVFVRGVPERWAISAERLGEARRVTVKRQCNLPGPLRRLDAGATLRIEI